MAKQPAAAPAANVTAGDVPLMPWEKSPPAPLNVESLLDEVEPDGQPDESEPEPDDESGAEDEYDDDVDPSEETDDDDVGDESDEEEPPARTDQPKKYKAKVDGGEVEVSLDELLNGYSRESDYRRKTMELADRRKTLDSEAEALRTTREQYAQQLQTLLEASKADEPDWDKLRQELAPDEFAQTFAEYELAAKRRQKVQAELDRTAREQMEANEKRLKEWADEQAIQLLKAVPEWQDEARATEEKRAIVTYAKTTFGMSDVELANLYDHRIIVALRKAMKYDALESGKEKLREKAKAAPVLKPGVPTPPKAKGTKAMKQARQQLARSGSVHDAAALIAQQLGD